MSYISLSVHFLTDGVDSYIYVHNVLTSEFLFLNFFFIPQNNLNRHKGSNTSKRARQKNLRHPRERFLVELETNRNLSCGCLRFFRLALLPVFDSFTVMQDISCKTKNLVYAIICSNCGEFYVGETKTELRTRMTVHRQQTRHQDLTMIRANEHFHDCSGGHFKIFPLYKVNTEGDFLRRSKETLLIRLIKIFKVI
jgi:hypothetical protein